MKKGDPRYSNGSRRRKLRARILASESHCALCGEPVDKTLKLDANGKPHPLSAEIDEKIPVSRGGNPLLRSNTQLVHRICNQKKGNKLIEELMPQPQIPSTAMPLPVSRKW